MLLFGPHGPSPSTCLEQIKFILVKHQLLSYSSANLISDHELNHMQDQCKTRFLTPQGRPLINIPLN